ncbi:MAG: hypothetical protein JL50_10850 [Peptococcaceae bacterium BICA1-7]|nr:MAG: hypothetical protein JL50_10850 [Peptococcaceae bacterium BICA1-7]HBV95782.1 hypothetical protein [Desulfotomaculum sp.]
MKLNRKTVDLVKLGEELTAAGVPHNALGTAGDEIFTYNEQGEPLELPAEAGVVIDSHVLPQPEPDPDEELAVAITAATTLDQLKNALLGKVGKSARAKGKAV